MHALRANVFAIIVHIGLGVITERVGVDGLVLGQHVDQAAREHAAVVAVGLKWMRHLH